LGPLCTFDEERRVRRCLHPGGLSSPATYNKGFAVEN
jgi:hypothetical protein